MSSTQGPQVSSRLVVAVALLGFASGLPNVLLSDTLSAWLADIGARPAAIGASGLLTLPYGLKLFWAPLLDRFPAPGFAWLGLRRSWIALLCVLLVAAFALLAAVGPASAASPLLPAAVAGLAIAALSATLDAAVDAHRTDAASGGAEGPAASAYVLGYRVAFVTIGSLVLLLHGTLADWLGGRTDPEARALAWRLAVSTGGVAMVLGVASALLSPEPTSRRPSDTIVSAVVEPFRSFVRAFGPRLLVVLFVALLFRLPDLLGNKMTMPFLRQHLGYTNEEIGLVRQAVGFTMTIVGAVAGGWCVKRWGLFRALVVFGILQVASNAGYILLDALGHGTPVFTGLVLGPNPVPVFAKGPSLGGFAALVVVENLCNGLVSAAFVAYFMTLCEPRYAAAQYALLSGMMYLANALIAPLSGVLVESLGYSGFFALSIAVGIPPLLALPWAMPRTPTENTANPAS